MDVPGVGHLPPMNHETDPLSFFLADLSVARFLFFATIVVGFILAAVAIVFTWRAVKAAYRLTRAASGERRPGERR